MMFIGRIMLAACLFTLAFMDLASATPVTRTFETKIISSDYTVVDVIGKTFSFDVS